MFLEELGGDDGLWIFLCLLDLVPKNLANLIILGETVSILD
jgi:hypothetical protein